MKFKSSLRKKRKRRAKTMEIYPVQKKTKTKLKLCKLDERIKKSLFLNQLTGAKMRLSEQESAFV